MRFNWVDLLSIGVVATAGGIQFMRGIRELSRVFYETVFVTGAIIAAGYLYAPLGRAIGVPPVAGFAGAFVLAAALGIWLAFLLNRFLPFDAGAFNYLFALVLAVGFGWVVGHGVLRSLYIALAQHDKQFVLAVRRSWMASQLLYFGAFWEMLAVLRFARYSNVAK